MKKIKFCTFALVFLLAMATLTACKKKDLGAGQGANPPAAQSTSGAGQGSTGTTSGSGSADATTAAGEGSSTGASGNSVKGSKNGAAKEGRGVLGGMMEDAQKGVNDMINGNGASAGTDAGK